MAEKDFFRVLNANKSLVDQLEQLARTFVSNFSHHIENWYVLFFVVQWYIQATCATQGQGLYEGLDWLSNELSK